MLPLFFKFSFKNVIGQIKLYRNYANIIMCQCPYIRVFALVKIYKLTRKPKIFAAMRVMSFNKVLLVFCISLAADPYSLYFFNGCQWKIYIQDHVFVLLS